MQVPLFVLGKCVATVNAADELGRLGVSAFTLLRRHVMGDFADMCAEDQAANRVAILTGERVFSAYRVGGRKFWVVTESDRSLTTVRLPDADKSPTAELFPEDE